MSPTHERWSDALVQHLIALAHTRESIPSARAELAELRASRSTGRRLSALPIVLPFLPTSGDPRVRSAREDDALLLAGLFAQHPEHDRPSFAAALRTLALEDGRFREDAGVVLRFRALLNTSREDLDTHLRGLVSQLAAAGRGFDWSDFGEAIARWDDPSEHGGDALRRRWARDFWAPRYEPDSDEPQS